MLNKIITMGLSGLFLAIGAAIYVPSAFVVVTTGTNGGTGGIGGDGGVGGNGDNTGGGYNGGSTNGGGGGAGINGGTVETAERAE